MKILYWKYTVGSGAKYYMVKHYQTYNKSMNTGEQFAHKQGDNGGQGQSDEWEKVRYKRKRISTGGALRSGSDSNATGVTGGPFAYPSIRVISKEQF